jgi:DHA1 family inner membrane transport protein
MNKEAIRITMLAILGSISIMPLLILPTVVGALVDLASFTESEAGWTAAVGGLGGAIGAIVIALRIRHLNPRKLAIIGLIAMIFFDALSMLVGEVPTSVFITFRALSGLGGAAVYAAVMTSYASMPNSERGYGIFMVLQFGLSAAGLYALPMIIPNIGVSGLYIGMAVIALVGFTMVSSVMTRSAEANEPAIDISQLIKPAAILAMIGIGLFEAANNMHFTYAERIGVNFAIDHETIGEMLGFATLLGMAAAFAVVWLGDRFGELKPILAALLTVCVGLLILNQGSSESVYLITMCMLSVAWAFGMPYFQAFEAKLDPDGSVVVAGGFFTSGGAALGPAVAATMVVPGDYSAVLLAAVGFYVVTAFLMIAAARLVSIKV